MADLPAISSEISEKAEKLYYALRLNKLSPKERKLSKMGVIDSQGYLTAVGLRIYMDYLWQRDKTAQEEIYTDLVKLTKDKKDKKSDED